MIPFIDRTTQNHPLENCSSPKNPQIVCFATQKRPLTFLRYLRGSFLIHRLDRTSLEGTAGRVRILLLVLANQITARRFLSGINQYINYILGS